MAINSRNRKTGANKPAAMDRRPQFRLNPLRQAFFVGLAVAGIAIGYGVGYLTKSEPPPLLPEGAQTQQGKPVRAYEEALPKDIIETTETRPAVKVLKVTAVKTPPPAAQTAKAPAPDNQDSPQAHEAAPAKTETLDAQTGPPPTRPSPTRPPMARWWPDGVSAPNSCLRCGWRFWTRPCVATCNPLTC